ncbi:MAG: glycosyltransferase [Elusimicrobia bacterium]|nr:glycosyltransferase [Elusimicrobiota bacterium]
MGHRILYISYDGMTDPLGGSQVIPYLEGLGKKGWRFVLLSFEKPERFRRDGPGVRERLEAAGIEWRPVPFHSFPPVAAKLWDQARLLLTARQLQRAHHSNLIHCRSYVPMEAGARLKSDFGVKTLFDMRGFWVDERVEGGIWNLRNPLYRLAFSLYKRRERAYVRSADAIVVLSEKGRQELVSWPCYAGAPVAVIPTAVDFGLFRLPSPEARALARRELGVPDDAVLAAYLGSLRTWYLLDEMVAFFAALRSQKPQARFLFLTPDPPELIRRSFGLHGLDPDSAIVRFAPREKVPSLLAAADLGVSFIKPCYSKTASSPTKLGEFMALGIPVVTNAGVGDVAEIVERTGGGLALGSLDAAAYARALESLPSLLQADRSGIRSRAKEYYDLDAAVERYDHVYRGLLPDGPGVPDPGPGGPDPGPGGSRPRDETRPNRKIVRIMDRLNTGGPAIHAILLARRFSAGPWSSVLVVGRESPGEGSMLDLAERSGVQPIVIPSLGRELGLWRDIATFCKLFLLIRREKPDVVHTHKSKAGALGRLAARLCGVPVVVHTFHGHVLHGYFGPLKSLVFRLIERFLAKMTDRIIAVSQKVKEDLVRHGVAREDAIEVVPLGLDLGKFLRGARGGGTLRRELGLGPDVPLVGIVARLVPIKRLDLFLQAARAVKDASPEARFVVVGDGELRPALEATAASLGLKDGVRFLGFRDDLEAIYPDLDVLTLTSDNEGSPVSLIEGLAAGCAVAAFNVGGVQDVVKDGRTGVLTPAGDARALANAVLELLADSARRGRLGEAGRADIAGRFSVERLVADLDALYGRLLASAALLP